MPTESKGKAPASVDRGCDDMSSPRFGGALFWAEILPRGRHDEGVALRSDESRAGEFGHRSDEFVDQVTLG
jgi:hypothetical protein